jgi:HEAT repeat protein
MDGRRDPRLARWLLAGCAGLSVLAATGMVLWLWLPGWAPRWVAEHSPWVDPVVRADVLGGFGGSALSQRMDEWRESAVPSLVDFLGHRDARMRHGAAEAISGYSSTRPAQHGTLAAALDDPDREVRRAAIECLGASRNPAALDTLLARLTTQGDDLRRHLAAAIGKAWRPEALAPVVVLLDDPRADVRVNACMALEHAEDARALEPLLAMFIREPVGELPDPSGSPREAAAFAMAQLPGCEGRLLVLLADPDPRLRTAAATALFWRGRNSPNALAPLLRALDDPEVVVRYHALMAIAYLDGAAQLELLLHHITDPHPLMKRAGIFAFRHLLKESKAMPLLIAALSDDDGMVRARAAEALGYQGQAAAVEPLLPLVDDGFPAARLATIRSLGQLGDARAVEPLLTQMSHSDPAIREAADQALNPKRIPMEREQQERKATLRAGWPKTPP